MINNFNPDSTERTIEHVKKIAFEIVNEAHATFRNDMNKMQDLWNVYNNVFDSKKYDYLTKVDDDLTYPAQIRDMASQVIRSKLNILESEQARRKMRLKAQVCDERSMKVKYEQRMKAVLEAIEASIGDRYAQVDETIRQVNEKLTDLENQLQVQPENEEAAMELEMLKQQMPLIRLEYGKMLRILNKEKVDMEDVTSKVSYFKSMNEVDILENICNAFISSLLMDQDKRDDIDSAFRDKLVTGRPTFLVYYDPKIKKAVIKQMEAMRSFYSRSSSSRWSDVSEWNATLEYMSLSQVHSEFDLSSVEMGELSTYRTSSLSPIMSTDGNKAIFAEDEKEASRGGIPVWRVWWLAPREWYWVRTPNKHRPGEYFNHAITDKKLLKPKKDDLVKRSIIYDRYSAVVIGGTICKTDGVDQFVYRPYDSPALPFMPLVCRSFNKSSDSTSSIIERTKDLREIYNIMWYMMELQVVLSGVRGMVMDKSQKPDSMSEAQWAYHRRMGTFWIETMKKGRKVNSSFNQFQTYDDTLSSGVQTIMELINIIENMIGKSMGITDPRLGQTVAKDPVHNVMMSQEQSSLITEILYYDADMVYSRALSQYLNLVNRFELKQGRVVNYLDEKQQEVLFMIPSGVLDTSDFRIHAWNNIQEDHMLDIIRQQAAASQMPLNALVSLYRINSLKEMEDRLTQIINEQTQIQTQNAMAIDNNKAEQEQRTAQVKAELDRYADEMKFRIEQAKIDIEKVKTDADLRYKQWEIDFKERELQANTQVDVMDISANAQVEAAYLQETQRSNLVKEALERSRMNIEAILQGASIKSGEDSQKEKNKVEIRKAELAATRRKNNIKD